MLRTTTNPTVCVTGVIFLRNDGASPKFPPVLELHTVCIDRLSSESAVVRTAPWISQGVEKIAQTSQRVAQLSIRLWKRLCSIEILGESCSYFRTRLGEVVDCRSPNDKIVLPILRVSGELLIWSTVADVEYEIVFDLKVQSIWFTPAIVKLVRFRPSVEISALNVAASRMK